MPARRIVGDAPEPCAQIRAHPFHLVLPDPDDGRRQLLAILGGNSFEGGVEPPEFLRDVLDRAVRDGVNTVPEAALHETLDMMSCKAAIKAGDRLSEREIAELLSRREQVERSSNCPHGRPTTLRLTIRDLEKQFGRR